MVGKSCCTNPTGTGGNRVDDPELSASFEALRKAAAEMVRQHDARVLREMEPELASIPANTGATPMPGDWHPAYANQLWLRDWLHGTSTLSPYHVRIPLPLRQTYLGTAGIEPQVSRYRVLARRRQAALAPYVGQPYVYAWWYATDELGRGIATEAERVCWEQR
jgi:RimJ/RimL family protein N-acetyltransferase